VEAVSKMTRAERGIVILSSLLAVILALATPTQAAGPAESAIALCGSIKRTTDFVTECEVGVRTLDLTIDTDGAEARKICPAFADMVAKETQSFAGGKWQLRIFSPYSGERPIAVCTMR
jgi:hypothetical protein